MVDSDIVIDILNKISGFFTSITSFTEKMGGTLPTFLTIITTLGALVGTIVNKVKAKYERELESFNLQQQAVQLQKEMIGNQDKMIENQNKILGIQKEQNELEGKKSKEYESQIKKADELNTLQEKYKTNAEKLKNT